jgi:hypothetical protein
MAYTCHRLCNVRVATSDSGCPPDTHCGGGYDMCMPVSYLEHDSRGMNEIDTAATVGEACAQNVHALYCGAAGPPGVCFENTGAPSGTCHALFHAGSECPAGQTAGYVAYKGGIDHSTLFCFQ